MLALSVVALLLLADRAMIVSTHISLQDLKNINETCKGEELCGPLQHTTDFTRAKCVCDEDCHIYGDCCRDARTFQLSQGHYNPFTCVNQPGSSLSYYMITRCPLGTDPVLSQLCESTQQSPDPISNNVPVTIPSPDGRKVIYRNMNCARCHGAPLSLGQLWTPALECSDDFPPISLSEMNLQWNDTRQQWIVPYEGNVYRCDIAFRITSDLVNGSRVCRSDVINKCDDNWQGAYDRELCQSYTALVIANRTKLYKNKFCAKCNNVSLEDLSCVELVYRGTGTFVPFTILLRDPEKDKICKSKNEIYDAVFDKCRNITCPSGQEKCSGIRDNSVSKGSNVSRIDVCKKVTLEKDAFELANDSNSVWVEKYERNFTEGHFRVTESGKLEICIRDIPQRVDKYSAVLSIVTLVGLGLSVFFLLVHLLAVVLVSELKNHSGMNLASLCVALLGAHSSFIAGGFLKSGSQRSCTFAAVFTYFFFMSAFFWMLVLAFDVWRVLRGAVRHFRTSQGKQWCRFFIYSVFAWGVPVILTGIALAVETAPPQKVDERFRPRFGEDSCWFSRRLPLVVFFALPLGFIMILNVIFFASSALMAARTRLSSASANISGHRRDYRLYLRLAILLGLTWVVGLLAGILNYEVLWIAFVLFNTLQGVFIFVMFTCTSKVVDAVTKPYPWTNSLRRSFKLAPAKPAALLPSDGSQSGSDSTMKSTSNTVVESSYQSNPSPTPRKSSAQL